MRIEVDPHIHTIATGHAFSTIIENAKIAKERGLLGICITDHGPARPDSPKIDYFKMLYNSYLPEKIEDVKIYTGVELNILSKYGDVDLPEYILEKLDFVIASFHNGTPYSSNSLVKNTEAIINTIKKPYIDGISHPGDPHFPYPVELEEVVKAAAHFKKALEVNNNALKRGKKWFKHYTRLTELCIKYKVPILISSDAHFSYYVGDFSLSLEVISRFGDEAYDLIINRTLRGFEKFIGREGISSDTL